MMQPAEEAHLLQSLCQREPFFTSLQPEGMKARMVDKKLIRLAGHLAKQLGAPNTPLHARMLLVAWLVSHHPEEVDGDAGVVEAASECAAQVRELISHGHAGGDPSQFARFIERMREWQTKDKAMLTAQLTEELETLDLLQEQTKETPEWHSHILAYRRQLEAAKSSLNSEDIKIDLLSTKPNAAEDIALVHNYYLNDCKLEEPDPEEIPQLQLDNPVAWKAFVDLCCTQLVTLLPREGQTRQVIEEALSLPIVSEASFMARLKTIHNQMQLLCAPARDQQLRSLPIDAPHLLWMLKCMNLDSLRFHLELLKPHLPQALIHLEQRPWTGKELSPYTVGLLVKGPSAIFTDILMGDTDPQKFQLVYLDAERLVKHGRELQQAMLLAWLTTKFRLNSVKQKRLSILIQEEADDASLAAELGVEVLTRDERVMTLMADRIRLYCRESLEDKECVSLSLGCAMAEQQVRETVRQVRKIYELHAKVYAPLYANQKQ